MQQLFDNCDTLSVIHSISDVIVLTNFYAGRGNKTASAVHTLITDNESKHRAFALTFRGIKCSRIIVINRVHV